MSLNGHVSRLTPFYFHVTMFSRKLLLYAKLKRNKYTACILIRLPYTSIHTVVKSNVNKTWFWDVQFKTVTFDQGHA